MKKLDKYLYNDPFRRMLEEQRRLQDTMRSLQPYYEHKRLIELASPAFLYLQEQSHLNELLLERTKGIAENFKQYCNIIDLKKHMPSLGIIHEANLRLSNILASPPSFTNLPEKILELYPQWDKVVKLVNPSLDNLRHSEDVIRAFMSIASVTSMAAEMRLSRFPWDIIGKSIEVIAKERLLLEEKFNSFAHAYNRLYTYSDNSVNQFAALPPVVLNLPPVELYNAVELAEVISLPLPDYYENRERYPLPLQIENEESLEAALAEIDPSLLKMLRGAKAAAKSKNPDRVRHVSISLRELLTQVLHKLAPDEEIKKWSLNSELYISGKPKRRARLLYICREINHDSFNSFVEEDVDTVLEFFSLFHKTTHEADNQLSEMQISALITRMESILRLLLASSKNTN